LMGAGVSWPASGGAVGPPSPALPPLSGLITICGASFIRASCGPSATARSRFTARGPEFPICALSLHLFHRTCAGGRRQSDELRRLPRRRALGLLQFELRIQENSDKFGSPDRRTRQSLLRRAPGFERFTRGSELLFSSPVRDLDWSEYFDNGADSECADRRTRIQLGRDCLNADAAQGWDTRTFEFSDADARLHRKVECPGLSEVFVLRFDMKENFERQHSDQLERGSGGRRSTKTRSRSP
jgi:hypothetical protein